MGILSPITKIASKALHYGRRALNVAPEFVLGDSAEIVGGAMRSTKGSIFKRVKAGAKALETSVNARKATEGGFFKRLWNNITNTPKDIYNEAKAAKFSAMRKVAGKKGALARLAAKNKTTAKAVAKSFVRKSTFKGLFKAIGKKLPFIGQALIIVTEVPNIYRAFRDGGVGAGLKEIFGAGVELGTMAAGAAIGSAICPGIGTIIGGIVGAIGGSLLRGKTFTEKQEEVKLAQQEAEQQLLEQLESQKLNPYDAQQTQLMTQAQGQAPTSQVQTPTLQGQTTASQPQAQRQITMEDLIGPANYNTNQFGSSFGQGLTAYGNYGNYGNYSTYNPTIGLDNYITGSYGSATNYYGYGNSMTNPFDNQNMFTSMNRPQRFEYLT